MCKSASTALYIITPQVLKQRTEQYFTSLKIAMASELLISSGNKKAWHVAHTGSSKHGP
jgi:competence CoiA-like predicted nuclease